MPRIRSVKPEFWADEAVARLPRDARLLFLGMLNFADDHGRMRGSPLLIRAQVFPYDVDLDVARLLASLREAGFIRQYESGEQAYIEIRGFLKHQKIDHPSKALFPEPPQEVVFVPAAPSRALGEPSRKISLDQGAGIREQGEEQGSEGKGEDLAPSALALAPGASTPTFEAYSTAFRERYGTDPVRNAKVSRQLVDVVKRLGVDEAPKVAAFYVSHNGALYVRAAHCIDLLQRDAEKLRMEWKTGKQITGTEARLNERTQANAAGWSRLLKEKPDAVG